MAGQAVVAGSASQVLWQVLAEAYARLGSGVLGDEAFATMVLARCVELATIEILNELGVRAPHPGGLAQAGHGSRPPAHPGHRVPGALGAHGRHVGPDPLRRHDLALRENGEEDDLRKVGISKEHRVDPQVQVGLLVDPGGFPLEMHVFEGNMAETTTMIPVLCAFGARHGVTGLVVVADAGMLSAANLNALEDAGFGFIVVSRITKAPTTWPGTSNGTGTTSPTGRFRSRRA